MAGPEPDTIAVAPAAHSRGGLADFVRRTLRIEGVPIVREADGLALSSRNAYLTPAERGVAPALNRALVAAAASVRSGADPRAAEREAAASLFAAGFAKVDYVEICDAATLEPITRLGWPARVLGAAWLGATRLIDNIAVPARR